MEQTAGHVCVGFLQLLHHVLEFSPFMPLDQCKFRFDLLGKYQNLPFLSQSVWPKSLRAGPNYMDIQYNACIVSRIKLAILTRK